MILVLLISIVIQRPVMLFYVQPTYMPTWNTSNFFSSAEIINTALDINIAAVIPLAYQLLQTLETLRENNHELEVENGKIKENKEISTIDLKIDKSVHKVLVKDIIYIESQRNHVKIKLINRELVVRHNISALQELLPGDIFIRVHRSYLVNSTKISSFSPAKIELESETIPVGRLYKEQVKKILGYGI